MAINIIITDGINTFIQFTENKPIKSINLRTAATEFFDNIIC